MLNNVQQRKGEDICAQSCGSCNEQDEAPIITLQPSQHSIGRLITSKNRRRQHYNVREESNVLTSLRKFLFNGTSENEKNRGKNKASQVLGKATKQVNNSVR